MASATGWMMTGQSITLFSGVVRGFRFLARQLIIVSIWLIAVGFFGTAYLITGSRQSWPAWDLLDFTGAFAIAAAISAGMTLILGGKKLWGFEITLSILMLIAMPVGGAYIAFWLAPTLGQGLLGVSSGKFLAFRRELLDSTLEFAWLTVPTGTILGIVIGAIAGLFLLLGSRWPRLAGRFVMVLLLVCAVSSVHIGTFRRVTDLVVKKRMQGLGSHHHAWYEYKFVYASTLGATAGAVVGATISCVPVWMVGRSLERGRETR